MLAEAWPGKTVFPPLDDPALAEGRVAVDYDGSVHAVPLAEHIDAVLQYGLALRMPPDRRRHAVRESARSVPAQIVTSPGAAPRS